ncbi:hypothetical protein ACP3XM_24270, partial [Salmonella enterica]|uniref:hypothetical protein n=1 Tax=Salmonella enterica TaxID=28901 RepID=UPI003CEBA160
GVMRRIGRGLLALLAHASGTDDEHLGGTEVDGRGNRAIWRIEPSPQYSQRPSMYTGMAGKMKGMADEASK